MNGFLAALQFLSIVPVRLKTISKEQLAGSLISFPVVGLLFGLILSIAYSLMLRAGFALLTNDILVIVMLCFITGGMHLDGLSDTFDAFLSGKSKDEMLLIMRDSHAGAMGVTAIVCILLLKTAFLHSVGLNLKSTALVIMCVSGRWSMVENIFLFPYARKTGKASAYIDGIDFKIAAFSCAFAIAAGIMIWGIKGLLVMVLVSIFAFLFGKSTKGKLGGITGDTIGACNELAEAFSLLAFIIIERLVI